MSATPAADRPDRVAAPDTPRLPRRLPGLAPVAATALALYLCYRLALPFLPAITGALALAVVAAPPTAGRPAS